MAHQVKWNNEIFNNYIKYGFLTEREQQIMKLRLEGKSVIEISLKLNVSESTINRDIKICKLKYDNCVKQYPNIFDKREYKNVWK